MKLTAEQITLRPSEPEDISLFYIWENDTEHWNSTNLTTPISKSALMDLVYNTHNDIFIDRQLRFVIAHKAENEPLGTIDLYDFDPKSMRCGIGIYIGAAHRRKGIAKHALRLAKSYAFNQLHVHQLYAFVALTNSISLTLFKDMGFVQAGILKDWIKVQPHIYEPVSLLQCITAD